MTRYCLLVVAVAACGANAGCGRTEQAELEKARADAEQAKVEAEALRKRLDALESKSAAPTAKPAAEAAAGGNSTAEPGNASAASPVRTVRTSPSGPRPGTVRLTIYNQVQVFSSHSPWIYVDGRLVRDLRYETDPNAPTLTLLPGEYLVEVTCAGVPRQESYPTIPFFLSSVGRRVKVEAGGEHGLEFDLGHLTSPDSIPLAAALAVPPGNNARGWAERWRIVAETKMKLYETDLVVEALRRLDASLGTRTAERRIAWLDIPEMYGGRREVNEAQVRLIVDWLKASYWVGWPADFTYRTDITYEGNPEAELQAVKFTDQLVKRHKEQIEQLKSVARKLEMGRE